MSKNNDLTMEKYSKRSVVVRGNTKPYRKELRGLGGKFNPNLQGGVGWIFSARKKAEIKQELNL